MYYWSGIHWKHILQGEFHFVFMIFENSKMAAPMDGPKPNDIVNILALMNMQDIAGLIIISNSTSSFLLQSSLTGVLFNFV